MTSTAIEFAPAWVVISGPAPTKVASDMAIAQTSTTCQTPAPNKITQRDAERHTDRHVHTTAEALPVRHTEDEDGRCRGEIGHFMAEQQARDQPREARGHRALGDQEGTLSPSLDTANRGCLTAPDRSLTEVECPQFQPPHGEGLGVHAS
jgi:hypothetical protein